MTYRGCQLAKEWTGWPSGHEAVAVEPKLDGYRLSALVRPEAVKFYCRDGEVGWADNLEHIAKELLAMGFPTGCLVDGEVMGPAGAGAFNATAVVRRKAGSAEQRAEVERTIAFHVFDLVDLCDVVWHKPAGARKEVLADMTPDQLRRERLVEYFRGAQSGPVRLVERFAAESPAEVQALLRRMLDEGQEGVMVKFLDAPYLIGARSGAWRKVKPVRTFDAVVDEVIEGAGKHAGRLGALACRTADGARFHVGTGFSDAQRAGFWEHREAMVGTVVEVTSQDSAAATAVVRHPSFVRVRPDRSGW